MARLDADPIGFAVEEKDITTVLADDISFKGTLGFESSLMIKGKFDGDIVAKGLLVIGENAVVNATIKSKTIIVFGKITGNVEASESIMLAKSSHLTGDMKTPDLVIQSGCKYNGNCQMTSAQSQNQSSSYQSQQQRPTPQPAGAQH